MKKMHNKFICGLLLMIFAISAVSLPVMADKEIKVLLNGVQLSFDVSPQLINNRTMVPMRKIFETLGATVEWYDQAQVIVATKSDTVIQLRIDSTIMIKNEKGIILDVPPQIIDDRTLVPVRAVAESFEAEVSWDEANQTVIITNKVASIETPTATPTPTASSNATIGNAKEVLFTSIKFPNDETVYPLFMRDVALIGNDGTCYSAQTTLYRILTMARYGYRIISVDDSPYFPGFDKVSDIPLDVAGFSVTGPDKTGSIYDSNNLSNKYLYSVEEKSGYASAIFYKSRCYLKITDVLNYFKIPYESVTYDSKKDNIIIKFKSSSELHQVEDES